MKPKAVSRRGPHDPVWKMSGRALRGQPRPLPTNPAHRGRTPQTGDPADRDSVTTAEIPPFFVRTKRPYLPIPTLCAWA